MGYGYGRSDRGRWVLACDGCGRTGGVRRRTCPYMVRPMDGSGLPYCPAPAYCADCYRARGGLYGVHGADCAKGAAQMNDRELVRGLRLADGDLEVLAAYGAWHEAVPEGMVGVMFGGLGARRGAGAREFRLIPADRYDPRRKQYLSDYPEAMPWADPERVGATA